MEAALCFACETREADAQIQPCGHCMCKTCLHSWVRMQSEDPTCPVCRQKIIGMLPHSGRRIRLEKGEHLGLTVQRCAEGVAVLRVNKSDNAYAAGLRAGDVITQINGICHKSHHAAIDTVRILKEKQIPISLVWRTPKRLRLPKLKFPII